MSVPNRPQFNSPATAPGNRVKGAISNLVEAYKGLYLAKLEMQAHGSDTASLATEFGCVDGEQADSVRAMTVEAFDAMNTDGPVLTLIKRLG